MRVNMTALLEVKVQMYHIVIGQLLVMVKVRATATVNKELAESWRRA